jgi:hypothetical protein
VVTTATKLKTLNLELATCNFKLEGLHLQQTVNLQVAGRGYANQLRASSVTSLGSGMICLRWESNMRDNKEINEDDLASQNNVRYTLQTTN